MRLKTLLVQTLMILGLGTMGAFDVKMSFAVNPTTSTLYDQALNHGIIVKFGNLESPSKDTKFFISLENSFGCSSSPEKGEDLYSFFNATSFHINNWITGEKIELQEGEDRPLTDAEWKISEEEAKIYIENGLVTGISNANLSFLSEIMKKYSWQMSFRKHGEKVSLKFRFAPLSKKSSSSEDIQVFEGSTLAEAVSRLFEYNHWKNQFCENLFHQLQSGTNSDLQVSFWLASNLADPYSKTKGGLDIAIHIATC